MPPKKKRGRKAMSLPANFKEKVEEVFKSILLCPELNKPAINADAEERSVNITGAQIKTHGGACLHDELSCRQPGTASNVMKNPMEQQQPMDTEDSTEIMNPSPSETTESEMFKSFSCNCKYNQAITTQTIGIGTETNSGVNECTQTHDNDCTIYYEADAVADDDEADKNLEAQNQAHALLDNDKILRRIMSYGNVSDLINWRAVCKKWNAAASQQLLDLKTINLNVQLPFHESSYEPHSISMFLNELSNPAGNLFPITRFSIKLTPSIPPLIKLNIEKELEPTTITTTNPLPQSTMELETIFINTQFDHITWLQLNFDFPEMTLTTTPVDFDASLSVLNCALLCNLATLSLRLDPRQLFVTSAHGGERGGIFPKLQNLEIEVIGGDNKLSIGNLTTESYEFEPNTFIVQLLKSTFSINSLGINAGVQFMTKILRILYSLGLHGQLQHLSLSSIDPWHYFPYNGGADDDKKPMMLDLKEFTTTTSFSSVFQLSSFKLQNSLVTYSLKDFLRLHEATLKELTIDFSKQLPVSKQTGHNFRLYKLYFDDMLNYIVPPLAQLHKLQLYYFSHEFSNSLWLHQFFYQNYFPNLQMVALKHCHALNYFNILPFSDKDKSFHHYCNNEPSMHDDNKSLTVYYDEDSIQDEVHNHVCNQIKSLELHYESTNDFFSFLRRFEGLAELTLHCDSIGFAKLISSDVFVICDKITRLSLFVNDKKLNCNFGTWDCILTGMEFEACVESLRKIRTRQDCFVSFDDLEKFIVNERESTRTKIGLSSARSIDILKNLQKFEIQLGLEPDCSTIIQLTEITLIFLLQKCKQLTSIGIHNSLIPKSFERTIRSILSPAFHLDLSDKKI